MTRDIERLFCEVNKFVAGSATGLVQLLVAAARRSTFGRIIACPTYPAPVRSAGLSTTVSQLHAALKECDVHAPTFFARLFASVRSIERRKRAGQFFTSPQVAAWALSLQQPTPSDNVCDAGAGTGVFAHAILRSGNSVQSYVGVENDPILALCSALALDASNAPTSYQVWYANFLLLKAADFRAHGLEPPTVVIANPPFIRFHNLSGRARIRKDLKTSLGISLSSLSGSGNYFLSRAAELTSSAAQMGNGVRPGRLMFFMPKEAAGAAHARRLRQDMEQLHGWTCQQVRVPQNQTGIDRHPSNALALLFLFEQQKAIGTSIRQHATSPGTVQDVIRVKRGISTGCNDFFVLTDKEARRRRIPRRYLREVLPTRIPITTNQITYADWEILKRAGRPCWLLCLPPNDMENFEPSVQDYLKEGLQRGLHETPTARSFRVWFSLPLPSAPPDLFITYLFRSFPRFVLNRACLLHLTNILGARFARPVDDDKRQVAIVDALTNLAKDWMRNGKPGREYKGGLLKIEPRELSMLPVDARTLKLINPMHAPREPVSQLLFE
jgi:predicted RNA methylase